MQISPQIYGGGIPFKNKNELSKFNFLDLAKKEKKHEKGFLDYLDLSSMFYAKVDSDLVQCWNCLYTSKMDKKLSAKVNFYGHMVAVKNGANPYIQLVALHVICLPCNRDFLDNGVLSYIDECPFKCGSKQMRQRIVVHASGVILKNEPVSLPQIHQVGHTALNERLKKCLEIIATLALSILVQAVLLGGILVSIELVSRTGTELGQIIEKINKLFQEKGTVT